MQACGFAAGGLLLVILTPRGALLPGATARQTSPSAAMTITAAASVTLLPAPALRGPAGAPAPRLRPTSAANGRGRPGSGPAPTGSPARAARGGRRPPA